MVLVPKTTDSYLGRKFNERNARTQQFSPRRLFTMRRQVSAIVPSVPADQIMYEKQFSDAVLRNSGDSIDFELYGVMPNNANLKNITIQILDENDTQIVGGVTSFNQIGAITSLGSIPEGAFSIKGSFALNDDLKLGSTAVITTDSDAEPVLHVFRQSSSVYAPIKIKIRVESVVSADGDIVLWGFAADLGRGRQ